MTPNKQLTQRQKQLVNDYHFLIYAYAKRKHIHIFDSFNSDMSTFGEDWYGVLAIGLCKAALNYKEELGAFPPFAFKTMDFAVAQAKRAYVLHNPKIHTAAEDLFQEVAKGNKINDKITDFFYQKYGLVQPDECDKVELRMILDEAYQKMGDWGENCRQILEKQASFTDIARKNGVSRQAVWYKYNKVFLPYLQTQIRGI